MSDTFTVQEVEVLLDDPEFMTVAVRTGTGWHLAYYRPELGSELDTLNSSHTAGFSTKEELIEWWKAGGHDD